VADKGKEMSDEFKKIAGPIHIPKSLVGYRGVTICLDNDKWLIKITEEKGFEFNKDAYPNFTADDFAQGFITALEKNFNIRFEEKE
jgi:phenolic acid decarboxylase